MNRAFLRFPNVLRPLGALLVVMAAAAGTMLHAQPPPLLDWTDISGPRGYSQFYELGNGTLFAREENFLVRSFDGGRTWQSFPRPGGPILEFDARGPAAVIAIDRAQASANKQYYQSTDNGNTWTRIALEPGNVPTTTHVVLALAADGTPHALAQAGAKMAVDRLVNGTWQRLGNPSGVYIPPFTYSLLALDPQGTIYIGSHSDGIHSTRDSGRTWTKALPYRDVSDIAFAPDGRVAISTVPNGRTAGGIFISADHGLTWTLSGMTDLSVFGLGYNPSGDLLALVARTLDNASTIYRLDAGIADWDSLEPFRLNYSVFQANASGRLIAASAELGLNLSDDDAATWYSDGVRSQDLYSTVTAPDGSLLAGTLGNGIFRTTNGGARWQKSTAEGTPEYFYTLVHQDTFLYAGTEHGLFSSSDAGITWDRRTGVLTPGGTDLAVYAISVEDGPRILIGTAAGIFRSEDRGASWFPSGLDGGTVNAIATSPSGTIFAVAGDEGVYASTDGGLGWSWKGLATPGLQTVAVMDNGTVYVGASSGVFVSTDQGGTWVRRIFTTGHVHSILFNGNFGVFAGSSAGLFFSTDGGRSWGSAGLDQFFVVALAYDPSNAIDALVFKGGVARSLQVVTAIGDDPAAPGVPAAASLSQNYPNPFNPTTTISYNVPLPSRVRLRIFDVLGQEAATLVDGVAGPGAYEASWNASGFPSGVYFYDLTVEPEPGSAPGARPFTQVRKMLLLR